MYQDNQPPRLPSSSSPVNRSLDLYTGQLSTNVKPAKSTGELSEGYKAFIARPHTEAIEILYPDGGAEITGCHKGSTPGNAKLATSEEEKRNRAQRRARHNLKQKARFNQVRYLWTLTVRHGLIDYEAAVSYWQKFIRMVKRYYPDFGAIGVPELHRGGGDNHGKFHIHFAVREFYDVKILRQCWYRVVGMNDEGKPNGQVDAKAPPSSRWSSDHIANYLMKYVTKDIFESDESGMPVRKKGQHYYWVTQNFVPPSIDETPWEPYGTRKLIDYQGTPEERERRLIGLLFYHTGKIGRVVYRSTDGRDFRIATG